MINYPFGSNSPKAFNAYPRGEFDLESGTIRKVRKPKLSPIKMVRSFGKHIHYYYKLHPIMGFFIALSFGVTILIILSIYESRFHLTSSYRRMDLGSDNYPFAKLRNLVMVAGHSVYTSSSCEKVDKEDSWFLETYQKHPGQASTFVKHIQEGVEITARDDEALLLFSGGETRKDAGPRSEAQSYWTVAESKRWFGEFLCLILAYNNCFKVFLLIGIFFEFVNS